jgi:hypothetical protein
VVSPKLSRDVPNLPGACAVRGHHPQRTKFTVKDGCRHFPRQKILNKLVGLEESTRSYRTCAELGLAREGAPSVFRGGKGIARCRPQRKRRRRRRRRELSCERVPRLVRKKDHFIFKTRPTTTKNIFNVFFFASSVPRDTSHSRRSVAFVTPPFHIHTAVTTQRTPCCCLSIRLHTSKSATKTLLLQLQGFLRKTIKCR